MREDITFVTNKDQNDKIAEGTILIYDNPNVNGRISLLILYNEDASTVINYRIESSLSNDSELLKINPPEETTEKE